ncbi:nucleotidyltransferase domain-containing protein [Halopiger thermotolerans]
MTEEGYESRFEPEERFVVRCVRRALESDTDAVARSEDALDWDEVLTITGSHGVSYLVLDAVRRRDDVPPEPFERLKLQVQRRSRRNLRLVQELVDVVRSFRNRGIRAIPYKGPVIAERAYGDIGRREFGDLDVLVSRDALPEARSVLSERGYQPRYKFTAAQEWVYDRVSREYPLQRPSTDTEIELHWQIVDQYFPTKLTVESVWSRRESLSIADSELPVLSPEDRLLMLCVHGTRHRWERLQWLCDVAAYVRRRSVDWETVDRRARAHHCERMVYLGLATADELLGVPLPDDVRRKIRSDPAIPRLRSHVYGTLFGGKNNFRMKRYQSRTLHRTRDKLRLWLGGICTPTPEDITAVSLPRPLAPLYVVVRWLRASRGLLSRVQESRGT